MVEYTDETLDAIFGAVADGTRRAILRRLARGEASVGELAQPFQMSFQGVSKHLQVLERAGLVTREKDGRIRRVHLRRKQMGAAKRWLQELESEWNDRFDKLDALLAQED